MFASQGKTSRVCSAQRTYEYCTRRSPRMAFQLVILVALGLCVVRSKHAEPPHPLLVKATGRKTEPHLPLWKR